MEYTGASGYYIKPSDPYEQKVSRTPHIIVGLPNEGKMI